MEMIYKKSGSAFSYVTDENGNVSQRKMSVSDAEKMVSDGDAVLFDSLDALKSNAQNYVANRQKEYLKIEEQLDKMYHDGFDGWKASIKAIKEKYPKP
jgi:hypothetical protein|tara:strand:- start:41 stop:334 length:294 start_codon:yes stop_codon:yes gene_type:complete